jgi:hypothetical protein
MKTWFSPEVLAEAQTILAKFPPNTPVLMLGHPRNSETDFPKDQTMSAPTKAECTGCACPVWGTVVKDAVRHLSTGYSAIFLSHLHGKSLAPDESKSS